jgi:hypothetical protein
LKKIGFLVVVLVIAIIGYNGKKLLKSRQDDIKNAKTAIKIEKLAKTYLPKEGVLIKKESFLALVKPNKEVLITTKIPGFIKRINVKENQKVKKGELLVQIDNNEITANIKALKSTISMQQLDAKIAKSVYEKNLKLYKVGGLSKEKLDLSKVAYLKKESLLKNSIEKLNQLKNQLTYLNIASPIDAIVLKKLLDEGNIANKAILKLANKKELYFEYANSDIKLNDIVFYKDKKIGYVSKIYNEAKNGLKGAIVSLTKDINEPFYSNINIKVLVKKAKGTIIPNNAIIHKKDGDFVAIFKDNGFELKKVTVLLSEENNSIIKEKLTSKIALGSEMKLLSLVFR